MVEKIETLHQQEYKGKNAWLDVPTNIRTIILLIFIGMNMTYFTSDQHFGHYNIIRLCGRPFKTQEEMDEILLSKWNAKVKDNDTVFILGDLFFSAAKVEPIL